MAKSSQDFVICQLEEPRYEEFLRNLNDWFNSLDCNVENFKTSNYSRISKEDLEEHLSEGTLMYIACTKSTNELVGTIGLGRPRLRRGKLTSELMLATVKTEYRKSGIAKLLNDEMVRIAKEMGAEKVALRTSYENKFVAGALFKNGYELTETKVEHKSNYTNTLFHLMKDYFVYNYFEKAT